MSFVVGLTGGIGSGKTAVSDWFATQGIAIIDADVIAHAITKQGSPILQTLQATFGEWVLDKDGNYDRPAMRAYIFARPDELAKLNAIMHPAIRHEIILELQKATSPYVMLSVPLLFESYGKVGSLCELCQHFLVVDVDEHTQLSRAGRRDNANLDNIKAIMQKQISRPDRLTLARQLGADVVDNMGGLDDLYGQLSPLHDKFLKLAQQAR